MTDRRRFSVTDKLGVMTRQAICPLCGQRLGRVEDCHFDHATALALGGSDTVENLQAVHRDCHAVKTTGRRGESRFSLRDGDQQRIAKTDSLLKTEAENRRRLLAKDAGETVKRSRWPSRPFPKRRRSKP